MSKLNDLKQFEKHHTFILVFLFVALIFAINVYAFTHAYDSVEKVTLSNTQPPRIDRDILYPEEVEPVEIDETQALDELMPIIEKYIDEEKVNFGIMVQDLDNDETISVNGSTTFVSASLYKIFVSYEIARQSELGLINLDSAVGFDAGDTTIRECIFKTLSYSDNDCGRALRKYIGASDSPIHAIAEAGFFSTSLINDYPTTNARDVTLFFEKIYDQTAFNSEVNDMLLDAMKAQEIDNRIPEQLPEGITIAHKTADLDGYSHDAGIVYSPGGDYIITILSGPWPNGYTDAPDGLATLSKIVYDWFNEYQGPEF